MPETVWIFAGSVVAALIVLFSGWLQQQISRASTVSGYRQKWIQDIRKAFSEYLDELEVLSDKASSYNVDNRTYEANSNILQDMHQVRSRRNFLQLFINPNEQEHNDLLEKAKSVERYLTDTVRSDLQLNYYETLKDDILLSFQKILKDEWDRVKMGELRWFIYKKFGIRLILHSSRRP